MGCCGNKPASPAGELREDGVTEMPFASNPAFSSPATQVVEEQREAAIKRAVRAEADRDAAVKRAQEDGDAAKEDLKRATRWRSRATAEIKVPSTASAPSSAPLLTSTLRAHAFADRF